MVKHSWGFFMTDLKCCDTGYIWILEFLPLNEVSHNLYIEVNAWEHVQTHRFPVCLQRWFDSIHRLNHTKTWSQGWYADPWTPAAAAAAAAANSYSVPVTSMCSNTQSQCQRAQVDTTDTNVKEIRIFTLWLVYDFKNVEQSLFRRTGLWHF